MTEFIVFNFVPVVLIECLVLRLTKWGKIWTCLLDSLLMNFASFICLMLGIAPTISSYHALAMLLYFTYCFLIEGFVLCLLERQSIKQALISAAASNFVSILYLAGNAALTMNSP
jgi:hypothetical protein